MITLPGQAYEPLSCIAEQSNCGVMKAPPDGLLPLGLFQFVWRDPGPLLQAPYCNLIPSSLTRFSRNLQP